MRNWLTHTVLPGCLVASVGFSASAATVFTNADGADQFLSNASNWDNGLPNAGNAGTVSIDAQVGAATLTDFVVTQTAGDISLGGFPNTNFVLSGATASWTMNGGSITVRAHNTTNGATFTLNNGTITNVNGNDVLVNAGTFIMNGGTIDNDEDILVRDGGVLTINGGTVDTPQRFGQNTFGSASTMNLNGGTITGGRFVFKESATIANFGGNTAGTATFADWGTGLYSSSGDRQEDNDIDINFMSGTLMSMTMEATTRAMDFTNNGTDDAVSVAWAQALWETDRLLYDGDSMTDLGGLTWADASNSTIGFGNGEYFEFSAEGSFGGTLSLGQTVIPEPASLALLGIGGLLLAGRRRR